MNATHKDNANMYEKHLYLFRKIFIMGLIQKFSIYYAFFFNINSFALFKLFFQT
jgi:hypothetical protein